MATQYVLNKITLQAAAHLAGDTWPDGSLHLARISRRTGIDQAVISRVTRGENKPNLDTLMRLASTYNITVEQLVQVKDDALQAA
jgi:transcriptional regulator with XRE-family HTH domain